MNRTVSHRVALFLPHLDVAGGLGVHCRTLVRALLAVESGYSFTIYAPADHAALFPGVASEPFDANEARSTIRRIEIPDGFSLANELDAILSGPLSADPPDVLYCSYYTGMRTPPCPQVVAFHDAGFLENPAGFGAMAVVRKQTVESIRDSIALLQCISCDARDRICRFLPWPEVKTAVVWHALPDSDEALAEAVASDPPPEFVRPYFLCPVGAATGFNRTRKNVPTAVTAFRLLPPGTARLVIAGTAVLTDKVLAELLPPNETGRSVGEQWASGDGAVTILPTVSRADLLRAMRHAVAAVYPSRYEGFGLPTIEAMAVGTPLIAARATSIPEVVGEAGILVDPDDAAGFAIAMRTVLTDRPFADRLAAAGQARLSQFSRERMGREMVDLFARVR